MNGWRTRLLALVLPLAVVIAIAVGPLLIQVVSIVVVALVPVLVYAATTDGRDDHVTDDRLARRLVRKGEPR